MPEGKYFYIKSKMHGLVLDVYGGCQEAGTKVIMWPQKALEDSDNQLWYMDHVTGVITSKLGGLCLDAEDRLTIEPYDPDRDSQQWAISGDLIRNRKDENKVLDIVGRSEDEGTEVCCWELHGEDNQQWECEHVPVDHYVYIRCEMHAKVLDVKKRDPDPGSKVVMCEKEDGVDSQLWYENKAGLLACKLNDCVLDASEGKVRLQTYDPEMADVQVWTFREDRIVHRHSTEQVLDIKGAKAKDGAKLLAWEWHGGDNQRFAMEKE